MAPAPLPRAFLRTAAGSAALAYGSGLLRHPLPAFADPPGTGTPVPIPGGAPELGGVFHVFLPFPGMEPSTIADFNGFTGLAVIDGHWSGPGATADSMYEADMRFMQGALRRLRRKVASRHVRIHLNRPLHRVS